MSSDRCQSTQRPHTWLGRAQWVVIPLIMFGTAELGIRRVVEQRGVWYLRTEKLARQQPINYLFLGNSRVTAAVDKRSFAETLEQKTGQHPTVDHLARGHTHLIHHYLALRNLTRTSPEHLQGCVVMLEIPSGLPMSGVVSHNFPAKRSDPWTLAGGHPQLLATVLQPGDLPDLFRSQTALELKLAMTFRVFTKSLYSISQRDRVREVINLNLNVIAQQIECRVMSRQQQIDVPIDLASGGGIRTDAQGVATVRKIARERALEAQVAQQPMRGWDNSLLAEIAQLCRHHQMQLVLFHMPQAPQYELAAQTEVRKADCRHFREWADRNDIPIVAFQFPTSGEDFPDHLHMCQQRGREFSKDLARAWVRRRESLRFAELISPSRNTASSTNR